ncbi:hypothetical protein QQM41_11680 [Acetobacter sp. AC2005]|uniref:hypothetical protein n=1 Tax=Acetobacter sp. AC2005 TaxID=3134142 RepID=UPI0030CAB9C7
MSMELFRENLSRNVTPIPSNETCAETVSEAMQRRYGDLRNAAKRVSRARGWSVKAFKNWFYGMNAPRMQDLIVLMADCPELEKKVGQMVEETRKCLQQSKL